MAAFRLMWLAPIEESPAGRVKNWDAGRSLPGVTVRQTALVYRKPESESMT